MIPTRTDIEDAQVSMAAEIRAFGIGDQLLRGGG
jgi:hypothetical protein